MYLYDTFYLLAIGSLLRVQNVISEQAFTSYII